jgi:hypothetical protein
MNKITAAFYRCAECQHVWYEVRCASGRAHAEQGVEVTVSILVPRDK